MNLKIFTILVATMFISMLGFGIVVPLLPIYANQLGATPIEIGLINGGFSLAILVFLPLVGRFSDRLGRKVFLCSGLGILTIASLGFIIEIKNILKEVGFDPEVIRRVAIASYEAEMNVVMYGESGEIDLSVKKDRITLIVEDKGPD